MVPWWPRVPRSRVLIPQPPHKPFSRTTPFAASLSLDLNPRNDEDDDYGVVSLAASFHGLRSCLLPAPVPTPALATAASPRLPQPSPRRLTRCFLRRVAGSRERVGALAGGISFGEYPRGLYSCLRLEFGAHLFFTLVAQSSHGGFLFFHALKFLTFFPCLLLMNCSVQSQ